MSYLLSLCKKKFPSNYTSRQVLLVLLNSLCISNECQYRVYPTLQTKIDSNQIQQRINQVGLSCFTADNKKGQFLMIMYRFQLQQLTMQLVSTFSLPNVFNSCNCSALFRLFAFVLCQPASRNVNLLQVCRFVLGAIEKLCGLKNCSGDEEIRSIL